MNLLEQTIKNIKPVDTKLIAKAYERLDNLTKPRRSLGLLEEIAARLAAIIGIVKPRVTGKKICVFVGDHDVVKEGVSAYPQEVTMLMVKNFIAGRAAVNVLAKRSGAGVEVIDIGMANDPGALPGLVRQNVRRGAGNISRGPAMSADEAERAVAVGINLADDAVKRGINLLATGEMGIGNTTPAAALHAAYLGLPVDELVGPGTGLDFDGVRRKVEVVNRALEVNKPLCSGPLQTLAALGGLEIAGICGLCLGAAARSRPVVVDGFISGASALIAYKLEPKVKNYMIAAHSSVERGHAFALDFIGLRPLFNFDLRLGEGTGAALGMGIVEASIKVLTEMATFESAGVSEKSGERDEARV